ncbi:MAG: hypothetical protein ACXAEF_08785 [Candidatus Thorarchaeota archaeon]|jgi:Arc/MetJ-type ribon-helix-helix transcriptional regulator
MTNKEPKIGKELQQSLRAEFFGRAEMEKFGLKKREISVMTRMSADIVDILDAFVEVGIFKSRSEAAAMLVEIAISSKRKMFDEIRSQAMDLRKKRESVQHLATQTLKAMKDDKKE